VKSYDDDDDDIKETRCLGVYWIQVAQERVSGDIL
jgi:hypothetical protein